VSIDGREESGLAAYADKLGVASDVRFTGPIFGERKIHLGPNVSGYGESLIDYNCRARLAPGALGNQVDEHA